MRVAIIAEHYLRAVVERQAESLLDAGHEVMLVCRDTAREFGGNEDERNAILDRLQQGGVLIEQVPESRLAVSAVPGVRRRLAKWDPDVLSIHANDELRLLGISFRQAPVVYTIHDPRPHHGEEVAAYRAFGEWAWRSTADCFVVHGGAMREQMLSLSSGRPVFSVPLGIDPAERPAPSPPEPRVVFMGRIEHYKGIEVLARAAPILSRLVPGVQIAVRGTGSIEDEISGLPGIDFTPGYVPEAEIKPFLASAKVVVLPYLDASQSGVGTIAMSMGIPLVVTTAGSLPDLAVRKELTATPGSAEELAEALAWALQNDGPDLRNETLEFGRSRFAWNVVTDRYLELFEWVTGRRKEMPDALHGSRGHRPNLS